MALPDDIDRHDNDDIFPEGATDPGEMLYAALHACIRRCALESDLKSYTTIGVLEAIKSDVLADLKKQNAGD